MKVKLLSNYWEPEIMKKIFFIFIVLAGVLVIVKSIYSYQLNGRGFTWNYANQVPGTSSRFITYDFNYSSNEARAGTINGTSFADLTHEAVRNYNESRVDLNFKYFKDLDNDGLLSTPYDAAVVIIEFVDEDDALAIVGADNFDDIGYGTTGYAITSTYGTCNISMLNTYRRYNNNNDNFMEVLRHEIGHCAGLAHSSEDSNEQDPVLRNALMYWSDDGGNRSDVLTEDDLNGLYVLYGKKPPTLEEAKDEFCVGINLDPDGLECLAIICYIAGFCK